jgi:methylated-DNA-[protein]-cysteine S-methyltransferase
MRIRIDSCRSPLGEVRYAVEDGGAHDGALCLLGFADGWARLVQENEARMGATEEIAGSGPREIRAALEAYFGGDLRSLDGLAVRTAGTPFQKRVWAALRKIPVGRTLSYGELAQKLGKPGAARAVGAANGSNPVSLVIPCHRVIAADGTLGGYGWGLPRKEWLLRHEGAILPERQLAF